MQNFIQAIKQRNEILFYFGAVCLLLAIAMGIASLFIDLKVLGVNAWYKPIKFALSTLIFSWAMAWYTFYVKDYVNVPIYSWAMIVLLGFEIVYIALQAGKGQLSHYNVSSPLHSILFILMAVAASLATIYTGYIGIVFFIKSFPNLPSYYVWGIRVGIMLFVIFSFQGFAMGQNFGHTVGAADGSSGIPFLNWAIDFGDLRVAHFIGMHALQVLPIVAFYLLKDTTLTLVFAGVYGLLAAYSWMLALSGRSILKAFCS